MQYVAQQASRSINSDVGHSKTKLVLQRVGKVKGIGNGDSYDLSFTMSHINEHDWSGTFSTSLSSAVEPSDKSLTSALKGHILMQPR